MVGLPDSMEWVRIGNRTNDLRQKEQGSDAPGGSGSGTAHNDQDAPKHQPSDHERADDLSLLTLQLETLFTLDPTGRLLEVNEAERPQAPYFFLGQTQQGNLWRYRADLPGGVCRVLEQLARAEPTRDALGMLPQRAEAFRDALEPHVPVRYVWSGPAYVFPAMMACPSLPASQVVRITRDNIAHLGKMVAWLRPRLESREPCFAVLESGQAVAFCLSARSTPRSAEAGVETLPAFRGRGYGAAVVTAWAQEVRQQGRTPLYSTAWSNAASQALARRIGLRQYATDFHLS